MDILGLKGFNAKKVLVTGGGGFIGSHLVRRLLEEGAVVSITSRGEVGRWRIKDLEGQIEIFNLDISDEESVNKAIKGFRPECIFHLAAYGVDSKDRNYERAVNTNVLGVANLIEAAVKSGAERFINIGSCAEYGDRRDPMKEDMCPEPVTIYGSTKACSTILAHQIAREKGLGIVTLRPFGIFGEGEEKHKIFSHVISSILEDKDVELTLCKQMRDYCYVENIIDGLLLAAVRSDIENDIFNIGTGEMYPLKYYIDLIFRHMNTSRKPLYGAVEYRMNEMWAPFPDISKIKRILGWEPRISLEEGIERTVQWFRENKQAKKYGNCTNER